MHCDMHCVLGHQVVGAHPLPAQSCCGGVECSGIPGSQPEPMGGLCECVSVAVGTGEGHIPQLGSPCALLPGGVSRFFLISFPRVPIS